MSWGSELGYLAELDPFGLFINHFDINWKFGKKRKMQVKENGAPEQVVPLTSDLEMYFFFLRENKRSLTQGFHAN